MKYARGGMTSLDYLIEIQRLEADVAKLTVENEKLLNKIAKIQFELDDVVSEWISVKDRLPEEGENVLTYGARPSYDVVYVNRLIDKKSGEWLYGEYVTHWMPLPQPPTNEDENI